MKKSTFTKAAALFSALLILLTAIPLNSVRAELDNTDPSETETVEVELSAEETSSAEETEPVAESTQPENTETAEIEEESKFVKEDNAEIDGGGG